MDKDIYDGWGAGLSVLFVDDDPHVLLFLQKYFKGSGLSIETARDGTEAFLHVKKKYFDLILTDICMPGPDGNCLLMYAKNSNQRTVVVGMSSDQSKLNASFDAVIHKPFSRNLVVTLIRKSLNV